MYYEIQHFRRFCFKGICSFEKNIQRMKKVLLLLVILSAFVQQQLCVAQTTIYHQFPDSNAVWNIHYFISCIGTGSAEDFYSIKMTGDTLLQNQLYHKLYIPYVESTISGDCFGSGYSASYQGAVREDTAERKVYFVPPGQSDEELLYDFTMHVNDTLQGYIASSDISNPSIVQEIDSVLVGNSYRKRWVINPCYGIYLIEGVGSTYGLITGTIPCVLDLWDYQITCFKQDDQMLYPQNITACELITVIENHEPENQFTLFPNPARTSLTIQSPEQITSLKIIDITGREIRNSQFEVRNSTIDISHLQKGVYVFIINGSAARKVVVE
jgi:hypothetical protein